MKKHEGNARTDEPYSFTDSRESKIGKAKARSIERDLATDYQRLYYLLNLFE
jgi:hypothetical protein